MGCFYLGAKLAKGEPVLPEKTVTEKPYPVYIKTEDDEAIAEAKHIEKTNIELARLYLAHDRGLGTENFNSGE